MNEEENKPIEQPTEDWQDKYLRAIAEMENMRKRMQKDKHEMSRFSMESAIGEFLPALDQFENALCFAGNASGEVKNWALGFEMILSQFKEILHNHGIIVFHSEGVLFDPEFHEAVEIVETTEHPEGMILQELSKGYKTSLRTIRPARVKVVKHPKKTINVPEETLEKETIQQ